MALKKKSILLIMAFLIGCFVCACGKEDSIVDESLVKDTEDVSSTEEMLHMKTKLKLFFEWGIELNETYPMRQAVVRKVHYANKKTIEEAIAKKYGLPQNPLQQPVKRPMQEQDKPLCNISKTMKGVEKSYD